MVSLLHYVFVTNEPAKFHWHTDYIQNKRTGVIMLNPGCSRAGYQRMKKTILT